MAFKGMVFLLVGSPSLAGACPLCQTENGSAVRAGIFNEGFLLTLMEVGAPFPAIGCTVYLIFRWLPN